MRFKRFPWNDISCENSKTPFKTKTQLVFAYCTSIFEVQGCNLKYYLKRGLNVYCIVLKRQADLIKLAVSFRERNIPAIKNSNKKISSYPKYKSSRLYNVTLIGRFLGWHFGIGPNFWQKCSQHDPPKKISQSPKQLYRNSRKKSELRVKEQVDLGIQLLKIRRWRLTDFCPSDGSTRWSCVFSRKLQRYTGRNQNHGS